MLHSFGAHPCQDQWEREGEGVGDVGEEEGEEEVEKGCKPVDDLPTLFASDCARQRARSTRFHTQRRSGSTFLADLGLGINSKWKSQ